MGLQVIFGTCLHGQTLEQMPLFGVLHQLSVSEVCNVLRWLQWRHKPASARKVLPPSQCTQHEAFLGADPSHTFMLGITFLQLLVLCRWEIWVSGFLPGCSVVRYQKWSGADGEKWPRES